MKYSVNLTTPHVLRVDTQPQEPKTLDEQLRSFWELESLGIQPEEKTLYDEFYYSCDLPRLLLSGILAMERIP